MQEEPDLAPERLARATTFAHVVDDVLMVVASHLPRSTDILNFGLTCRRVFPCVLHALYADVHLGLEHSSKLLKLLGNPERACFVRRLSVQVDDLEGLPDHRLLSTSMVELAPSLRALEGFEWRGWNIPACDQMWETLRICCTKLHTISTTLGPRPLLETSHLYRFDTLTSFSVQLTDQFFEAHAGPAELPALTPLFDMLLFHCPLLHTLRIIGLSDRPAAFLRLVSGRWPNLHTIALGDVLTEPPTPAVLHPGTPRPLLTFLAAHPALRDVQLSAHANLHPTSLAGLPRTALQKLERFSGSIFHASTLRSYKSLRTLELTEPLRLRSSIVHALCAILAKFKRLECFRVQLIVENMEESESLLRTTLASCPQLKELGLVLGVLPSVPLRAFPQILDLCPSLQHLDISIVPSPKERESMRAVAERLFRGRELRTIRFVALSSDVPLRRGIEPYALMQGRYEAQMDLANGQRIITAREESKNEAGDHKRTRYLFALGPEVQKRSTSSQLAPGMRVQGFSWSLAIACLSLFLALWHYRQYPGH